jgi:hypothetical protein
VILIYYNPVLEDVLRNSGFLRTIGGTCQYAIYSN